MGPRRRAARVDAARQELRHRYLALLRSALLDEQYLENEVRLEHLLRRPELAGLDLSPLRDPARTLRLRYTSLLTSRRQGDDAQGEPFLLPYADEGRAVLDHAVAAVERLAAEGVGGDVVECGCGRGGMGILLRAAMDVAGLGDRRLWMVGPFPASETDQNDRGVSFRADLNQVRDAFERFGVGLAGARFLVGETADALADAPITEVAMLRIGDVPTDDLAPTLELVLPRLADGASLVVAAPEMGERRRIIGETMAAAGVQGRRRRVDDRHVAWERVERRLPPGRSLASLQRKLRRRRAAVPAPRPGDGAAAGLDLSVVVVFYNMSREAARTLHSLSRQYQRGIDDLRYEVIAVDNGSDPEHRLQPADVARFGPEFRLVDMGSSAEPSPTVALNRAIGEARGDVVALMIDGAHVLTPGAFAHALTGLAAYAPAVVGLQQWYVGPGQQGDAQRRGYDQAAEDRLFYSIDWPVDGYRLFNIGHFIGERDWLDGMTESSCLFVPRQLLEQVGGFDDSFDMPGGGFANLELYERLALHPGVTVATVLGEASFHQVHGGTTTNIAADVERRETTASYAAHFEALRGRELLGMDKAMHYVGALATATARRTRARWGLALANDPDRDPVASTPDEVEIVPDDVRSAATHAAWSSQAWRDATWLGHRVHRYPTDLHVYQELVVGAGSSDVVLVADDPGLAGRARFFASVCEHRGRGRVLVVGDVDLGDAGGGGGGLPERIRCFPGGLVGIAAAAAEVDEGGATVFIGLGAADRVVEAFEQLCPVVPVGGVAVVEGTVLNGWPVVPSFGPGPHEAVTEILRRHHDWAADVSVQRYPITFNPGGYLRRIS